MNVLGSPLPFGARGDAAGELALNGKPMPMLPRGDDFGGLPGKLKLPPPEVRFVVELGFDGRKNEAGGRMPPAWV